MDETIRLRRRIATVDVGRRANDWNAASAVVVHLNVDERRGAVVRGRAARAGRRRRRGGGQRRPVVNEERGRGGRERVVLDLIETEIGEVPFEADLRRHDRRRQRRFGEYDVS